MARQVSAEQKDQIIKEAYSQLDTYSGEGRAVAEYSVDVTHWLESQPKVSRAALRGRNTITVEFADGTQGDHNTEKACNGRKSIIRRYQRLQGNRRSTGVYQ